MSFDCADTTLQRKSLKLPPLALCDDLKEQSLIRNSCSWDPTKLTFYK